MEKRIVQINVLPSKSIEEYIRCARRMCPDTINITNIPKKTTMTNCVTECCGYDFGADGFNEDVQFCPICGAIIIKRITVSSKN